MADDRSYVKNFLAFALLTSTPTGCLLERAQPPDETTTANVHLNTLPPAPPEAVPRVLQLQIQGLDPTSDAHKARVFSGKLSPSQIRRVWDDDPSQSVQARQLPSLEWLEDDGRLGVALQEVQPAGDTISVVTNAPPSHHRLTISSATTSLPLATLRWPLRAGAASPHHAIYCSGTALTAGSTEFVPQQQRLQLLQGAGPGDPNPYCLHVAGLALEGIWSLPRPQLLDASGTALAWLGQTPIQRTSELPPPPVLQSCPGPMLPVTGGCARVEDDRILLRNGPRPLFWSVVPQKPVLHAQFGPLAAGQSMLIHPLPTQSSVQLFITNVDEQGRTQAQSLRVQTQAAMPHVVINEVLANPVGPEPQQEWIELYNDGLATADLSTLYLEDIGGRVQLPPSELKPGRYALLVNDDYDANSEYDPKPAGHALILRVPKLGKDGLKNSGEPLKLVNEQGLILSRFPTIPKPKSGQSVLRIYPQADDDTATSFVLGAEGQSTPGSANPKAASAPPR